MRLAKSECAMIYFHMLWFFSTILKIDFGLKTRQSCSNFKKNRAARAYESFSDIFIILVSYRRFLILFFCPPQAIFWVFFARRRLNFFGTKIIAYQKTFKKTLHNTYIDLLVEFDGKPGFELRLFRRPVWVNTHFSSKFHLFAEWTLNISS